MTTDSRAIRKRSLILRCMLLGISAVGGCRKQEHTQPHAAAFDWSNVTTRDLNIASVFLVARSSGIRPALDSLTTLVQKDTALQPLGHQLAHALGRFAIAQRNYDLSVFAECRPTFLSGCYHGVIEGYLSAHPGIDPATLRNVCFTSQVAKMPRYAFRECAHGIGHGLMAMRHHDLNAALADCGEVLQSGIARRECYDGAFMENVVHSVGTPTVNVGDTMANIHMHMVNDPKLLRANDPYFPCDSIVSVSQQPSCWSYQPVVFYTAFKGDMHGVVKACESAPPGSAAACFRGLGKQTIGRLPNRPAEVERVCGMDDKYRVDCIAGAVEYFVDLEWKLDPAFAFCRSLSPANKETCYRTIGEKEAWIDTDPAAIKRACDQAEARYAANCARIAGGAANERL